ncbi:MAG: nitrous oxide reductase family maturation protein NosD [Acidimicrobiales bacterium]
MHRKVALLSCIIAGLLVTACGSDPVSRVISVPADAVTIQEAVDDARPGDIVEISPGTYRESVKVTTAGIVIRGTDRNAVVLDGGDSLANGIYVAADGVRVENLTVHSYTQNGVVFNGIDAASGTGGVDPGTAYGTEGQSLDGYEVRYVTAYNNGLYGIYAFASVNGLIEHSYASGHPDSGIYVGQCRPCNAVVRRNTSELNAIGYYGTNASGDVWVIESTWRRNRLGIAPNSQEMEKLAPQEGTTVAGNTVIGNNDPAAPAIKEGFFGGGIVVGGGSRNVVVRNRVENHTYAGIAVIDFNRFTPLGNRIENNTLSGNRTDLMYRVTGDTTGGGNCFTGNTFAVSAPADIETVLACGGTPGKVPSPDVKQPVPPPDVDHRNVAVPPAQENMPADGFDRPAGTAPFVRPDLTSITLP